MSSDRTSEDAPDRESPPRSPDAIMQLANAYWGSKVLLSAVGLGLFSELASAGPLPAHALGTRLGLHPRSTRDFLDALVALELLERHAGEYRNTPETSLFLDRAKPTYAGGFLEMADSRLFGFWNSLTEGLRTGRPQNEAKSGGNMFDAIYPDPDKLGAFLRSMSGVSAGAGQALADAFDWERYETVVDVGCAEGFVPTQIARRHPHITGGGFDLPPVKPHFDAFVDRAGLGDRLRFHGGDFFADPLPSADVLIMGNILHDWSLDEKRRLLGAAYQALAPGGALIVYEAFIDDSRRDNAAGLLMSLNMLIETPGGFNCTWSDCRKWMGSAGFSKTDVHPLTSVDSMVVGFK